MNRQSSIELEHLSLGSNLGLGTGSTRSARALVTTRTSEVRLSVGSDGSGDLDTSKVFEVKRLQEFL